MVDVLLSSDNIDVLGGTPQVNVNLSSGSRGQRGNYILVGSGNPNNPLTYIPTQTVQTYDMFINLNPNDVDYLYLYQYLNWDGEFQWVQLLRLIPNTFLDNYDGTFVSGKMQISIPLISILPLASSGIYQASNFNVQHTLINSLPTASSIEVDDINLDTMTLNLTLTAVQFNGTAWENVPNGAGVVHLIVTVV
jgi:hypothetical protein